MKTYLIHINKQNRNKLLQYGTIEHEFKLLDGTIVFNSDLSLRELRKLDFIIRVEPDRVGTFN